MGKGAIFRVAVVVWTLMWIGAILLGVSNLDGYTAVELSRDVALVSVVYATGLLLLLRRRMGIVAVLLAAAAAFAVAFLPVSANWPSSWGGAAFDCGGSAFAAMEGGPNLDRLDIPQDAFESYAGYSPGALRFALGGQVDYLCQRAAIARLLIGAVILFGTFAAVTIYPILRKRRHAEAAE